MNEDCAKAYTDDSLRVVGVSSFKYSSLNVMESLFIC